MYLVNLRSIKNLLAISAISKARCEAVKSSYGILVVPLLFETTGHKQAKRILVVDCEPQTQISRVVARSNITPKDVKAIMATQVDRKIRIAGADDIITNSGDLENLELQSSKLHEKYEKIAQLAQKSSKDKK